MKAIYSLLFMLVVYIASTPALAETCYLLNIHLGTPQVLIDSNQAVVWEGSYDPFGEVTETVAVIEQNLRFPGQCLARETGLHYNYFRPYDPAVGRCIDSDPIGLRGGLNTYGYVGALSMTGFVCQEFPFAIHV